MAAISPDGRYVVHVKGEPGGLGLWTRQTATTSDVRIVPPGEVRFDGLAFAPDGNYVYYSAYRGTGGVASLFKVPVLGGTAVQVLEDIDSPVTFSPDGSQIAFMRGSITRGTTEMIVAASDGSNPRVLAAAPAPDRFQSEGPAWSPDGRTILATAGSSRPGTYAVVHAVDVATGQARQVGEGWGFVRDVRWLAAPQVWQVAFPGGERSRVTNDLNAYTNVTLSADGKTLTTVQTETNAGIFVVEAGQEPRRVTGGSRREDGTLGLSWLADGRIVFTSTASGMPQIWIVDGDGRNMRQLTTGIRPALRPRASPDGRYIYFQSPSAEGIAIFRMTVDGSGLEQMTRDGDARDVVVAPDGKTLYYTAQKSGTPTLMKLPAAGGEPERVSPAHFRAHDIAPDGSTLLGASWNEPARRTMLATVRLPGGTFDFLPDLPLNALFMPDGSVVVVVRRDGIGSVVVQPLHGGTRRVLGAAGTDNIFNGAVARDGKIAFSRGTSSSDVVLIRAK